MEKCLDCGVPPGPLLGQLQTYIHPLFFCASSSPNARYVITSSVADPGSGDRGKNPDPESGMNSRMLFFERL